MIMHPISSLYVTVQLYTTSANQCQPQMYSLYVQSPNCGVGMITRTPSRGSPCVSGSLVRLNQAMDPNSPKCFQNAREVDHQAKTVVYVFWVVMTLANGMPSFLRNPQTADAADRSYAIHIVNAGLPAHNAEITKKATKEWAEDLKRKIKVTKDKAEKKRLRAMKAPKFWTVARVDFVEEREDDPNQLSSVWMMKKLYGNVFEDKDSWMQQNPPPSMMQKLDGLLKYVYSVPTISNHRQPVPTNESIC